MTTDNRSEISDCDSDSGNWSGDSTTSDNSDIYYQGAGSLSVQATNSYRGWYRDAATSWNLQNTNIYFIIKPYSPDTETSGGIRIHLGDGSDARAYYVGGSDNLGIMFPGGWSVFVLDTANLPASYSQEQGSAEPDLTAITECGMGVLANVKAIGNVVNTFLDRISYIANGSPAFEVDGGTVGTPETFADLHGDDVTNGWGFFANLIPGSKAYAVLGAVEWGDDTAAADSYFEDSDAQIYFVGTGLTSGTMDQDMLANSTGTNSFVLNNCVMVAIGEPPNWNFEITDHDILELDTVTFSGHGTFQFPVNDGSKFVINSTFDICEQIDPRTTDFTFNTIKNTTDASGGLLLDADDTTYLTDLTFISDGTGYGMEVSATGTYTIDGFTWTNYGADNTTDAAVNNSSAGTVTLNIQNGSGPTVSDTSDTFVVLTVNLKLTVKDAEGNALVGASCFLEADSGGSDDFLESVTSITRSGSVATVTHSGHSIADGEMVTIRGANQPEYNGAGKVTTYISATQYSYVISGTPIDATGTITATQCYMFEDTIAGGIAQQSYAAGSAQPARGWVRWSTAPNLWIQAPLSVTDISGGIDLPVQMASDEG